MSTAAASRLLRSRGALLTLTLSAGGAYTYHRLSSDTPDPSPRRLDARRFAPFTLLRKDAVSSTASIFTLRSAHAMSTSPSPSTSSEEAEGSIDAHAHWGPPYTSGEYAHKLWSIETKQPDLQIARSYTPLPPTPSPPPSSSSSTLPDASGHTDTTILRLLIRALPRGEMSPYLHALAPGATMPIRGPRVEADLTDASDVLFLAAGTGIAPGLQCAYWMARTPGARMRLMVANRRREDVRGAGGDGGASWWSWIRGLEGGERDEGLEKSALVSEIEAWKTEMHRRGGEMRVEYFVDEEGTWIDCAGVRRGMSALEKRDTTQPQGRKIIFVSGPEGFVEHWAGPKVWKDGKETQGPVRGVLGQMKLDGWEVVKL